MGRGAVVSTAEDYYADPDVRNAAREVVAAAMLGGSRFAAGPLNYLVGECCDGDTELARAVFRLARAEMVAE